MQNYSLTKLRGKPLSCGFRGMLAAMLFGTFLYATGVKAAALSGPYTIDASGSGNYTTFKAAIADLTTNGVSGPVTFNVTAATYAETVTIGSITGASSTNTITFHGAGRDKTFLSSTGVIVSVTAYTFFDGMSIVTTGGGLIKANSSNDCGFSNCNLLGTNSGTANLISANSSKYLTLYNCEISGGGNYGLSLDGTSSGSNAFGYLRCSHNRFVNQNYECIDIEYDFKDSIAFNTFDSASGSMDEPMYCEAPNGLVFWGNKVFTDSYDGIDIYDPDEYQVSGFPTQSYFVNNWIVISDNSSNNYEGVDIDLYQCSNFTLAFNTFYNFGAQDEGLYLDCDYATNTIFADNIFYGTVAGYDGQYDLYDYSSSFKLFDGNDIYSTASGTLAYVYNGTSSYSFTSYSSYASTMQAAGWELNGTNTVPPFVSLNYPYDLHMSTSSPAPKGVAGTGITTDIDQKGRFPAPTPGASESYYGIVNDNTGVTAMISPYAACPGTVTVAVTVTDLGLNAVSSGGTIAWSWNGVPQTPVNYSNSIPLYGQINITLGTETLTSGVPNTLKAWPTKTNGNTNPGGANDTLTVRGILASLGGGTYTIDGTKATGGSNFKTFGNAATALSAGVCGPVVFNVTAATYNESVSLGTVPGASAVNTVTFNGAGRLKTTLTSNGTTIAINGASYVTFDNMTISTTGTSATSFTIKESGSTKCRFISDNLSAPDFSKTSGYVITTTGTGLVVQNCRVVGGYYSLNNSGHFDSISNNRFIGMGYYGWYTGGVGNVYFRNVVDSVSDATPYAGVYSTSESGATYDGNYFNFRNSSGTLVKFSEYGIYFSQPNSSAATVGTQTAPLTFSFVNNIEQAYSQYYGLYWYGYTNKGPNVFAYNTISNTGNSVGYYPLYLYWYNNNGYSPDIVLNNILESDLAYEYGLYEYEYNNWTYSGVSAWDNGDTLFDGNDWIINAPTAYYFTQGSITASSVPDYLNKVHTAYNWERHGVNVVPNYINPVGNLFLDTTKASPVGVAFSAPVSNSTITYTPPTYDITGRKRCALFPTIGAFENPFGKAPKATKIYVPSSGVYPGSPATIYQSHVASDPAVYIWYIQNSNYSTWTPISTSVNLYYSGWTTGTNKVKLVTQSCNGTDADSISLTINAPSAVPVTDFIAASNAIQQNTADQLTDLSTNGPTKWQWTITPDSITVGTLKQATTNQASVNTTQNPDISFYYPGYYKVCLTAYNGLGKGAVNCKSNYIQVVPAINLSSTPQTVTTSTGYIFDNGGPQANYTATAAPYIQSVLIAPCADSIYLTFSQFDTKCGNDFVKLYNGSSPTASTQINTACSGGGTSGGGPGFNGGPTNSSCPTYCIPNVNRPDTFKSGPKMLLTMFSYTGNAPGFAAYYWVKPSSDKRVTPTFATTNGSDSVCAGQLVTFNNTTATDPKDVPSFEWDLNGDISDGFECVGACATAQWPYFLPGTVPVTLIAINCGGADTLVKNITVISPPKPVAVFSANITAPTLADVVTFTSGTVQCVDDYKWTISASAGTVGGAAAVFVNGTSATSPSPQVSFPDTGYYDVSLYVDNASGTQSNTKTILKYIHVREPYCQPSVASLSSAIGINHVVFNTIDNYTTPQASSGYLNFVPNATPSTTIAIGATYTLSVSRDPNSIFSPINRDAWIDWNEDGSFTGSAENVLKDSNTTSVTSTAKVTVPIGAKTGATILRVATNLYLYPNAPCGPNQFGEYEDYRVYVTPYNILPVITLKGVSTLEDTIVVEQGYAYTEPGDSASSYLYGDITKNVVITSKQVVGSSLGTSFSNLVPGTYQFSYNVTDAAGNKAITKYRLVRITPDVTPPTLTIAKNSVSGTDTIFLEVSNKSVSLNPPLSSYLISSIDLVDGNITRSVIIDSSLVTTAVVGIYPVTFISEDASHNTAVKILYVDVIDTIKPVLTLKGPNPEKVEVYVPFADPGVNISVSNLYLSASEMIKYLRVTSNVNDSVPGTYLVTYSLTDTFGNVAKPVTRVVIVADTLAPVITLLGPVHDSVPVNNTFYDRGYTVSDNYSKTANIKVTTTGTFVTAFHGTSYADKLGGGRDSANANWSTGPVYRLTYTATDQAGNKGTVTRYVEVYDNVAPVITLVGPNPVNVCRWFPYSDNGYTLTDNFNDSADMQSHNGGVQKFGTFLTDGTSLSQLVSLYYTVKDQFGNIGTSQPRYINVKEAGSSGCTSGIAPGLSLDKYITVFPNPSSGIFNVEANLPASQNVRISVMNMLGQEMMVVHDGNLANNSFRIDLSGQPSGVYFLNIVSNNQTLTKRIEIAK